VFDFLRRSEIGGSLECTLLFLEVILNRFVPRKRT
jgi:hypothetical protein